MAHQYAPVVEPGGRIVTRRWPDDPPHRSLVEHPRDDLLLEQPEPGASPGPDPLARAGVRAGARAVHRVPAHHRPRRRRVGRIDRVRRDDPLVRLVVPLARAGGAGAADLGSGVVGATRSARPDAGAGARPARGRVDERGVRQHAVHPDGERSPPTTSASTTPASASPARSSASASSSPSRRR